MVRIVCMYRELWSRIFGNHSVCQELEMGRSFIGALFYSNLVAFAFISWSSFSGFSRSFSIFYLLAVFVQILLPFLHIC